MLNKFALSQDQLTKVSSVFYSSNDQLENKNHSQ